MSSLALWIALLSAFVLAVVRARPAALFTFRTQDVLWGIAVGLGLRLLQGVLTRANSSEFPQLGPLPEHESISWIFSNLVAPVLIGPVVEELYFRAVLLVVIYQLLRQGSGSLAAAATATLVSAGLFVILHVVFAPLSLLGSVQLFLFGCTLSGLVFLTGRVWPAVLAHVTYNGTFFVLGALGLVLA